MHLLFFILFLATRLPREFLNGFHKRKVQRQKVRLLPKRFNDTSEGMEGLINMSCSTWTSLALSGCTEAAGEGGSPEAGKGPQRGAHPDSVDNLQSQLL